jgi:hypothetical protein|nr:MAG TPA: hypothetical protein [Caudoviricetes sp.]
MSYSEKLSIVLSIIGLLGGFSSWIYNWQLSKVKMKFRILSKKILPGYILLHLSFSNESRLPIALTQINLLLSDEVYTCKETPTKVKTLIKERGSQTVNKESIYTENIPINIPALSACSGYVLFLPSRDIPLPLSNTLSFEVHTNRDVINKISLQLPAANLE